LFGTATAGTLKKTGCATYIIKNKGKKCEKGIGKTN
jgi:hypothetical protein